MVAQAAVGQAVEPTLESKAYAAALCRRLEAWRARVVAGGLPPPGGYAAIATADKGKPVSPALAALDSQAIGVLEPPALRFDSDFDSGSLGAVQQLGSREYELRLMADVAASGQHVQWFCFRIRGMQAEETYTFHLTNLGKPASLFDEGCQPVLFSKRRHELAGVGWTRAGKDIAYFPCDASSSRRYCISLEVMFPHGEDDEVFLAHAVPYTHADMVADFRRWQHPSEFRRWSIAQSCGGQDILAISLGNPQAKQAVCVIARAHPGETNASWAMRGFMDFLMGGSKEAEACLRHIRWLVVPMLNPDGVVSGRTRTNLEGVDLNRHHHDAAAPETRGLRATLQEEVQQGAKPLAFVDIHSHSRRRGVFFITNGREADPLVSCMAARSPLLDEQGTSRPEVRQQDEGVGRVAATRFGYQYSATLETSLAARHTAAGGEHLSLEDLQGVGHALGLALLDLAKLGREFPHEEHTGEPVVSPELAPVAPAVEVLQMEGLAPVAAAELRSPELPLLVLEPDLAAQPTVSPEAIQVLASDTDAMPNGMRVVCPSFRQESEARGCAQGAA